MGGILILKSSNHWGRGKSIWGDSDNGKQRGGGGYITQFKTIIILEHSFFQGKITFMVTFKEKIVFIFTSLVSKGLM